MPPLWTRSREAPLLQICPSVHMKSFFISPSLLKKSRAANSNTSSIQKLYRPSQPPSLADSLRSKAQLQPSQLLLTFVSSRVSSSSRFTFTQYSLNSGKAKVLLWLLHIQKAPASKNSLRSHWEVSFISSYSYPFSLNQTAATATV